MVDYEEEHDKLVSVVDSFFGGYYSDTHVYYSLGELDVVKYTSKGLISQVFEVKLNHGRGIQKAFNQLTRAYDCFGGSVDCIYVSRNNSDFRSLVMETMHDRKREPLVHINELKDFRSFGWNNKGVKGYD